MKNKFLISLLLCTMGLTSPLRATFLSIIETDLENFTLWLCVHAKNAMRIEHYPLKDLNEGTNYISKKMSQAHCSHIIHLGEQGLHVSSINLDENHANEFKVASYRGKKAINFVF